MKKRIREFGVQIGSLEPGVRNAITDVPGVTVGHVTLRAGSVQTGVTAIVPHPGNLFREKVAAAVQVINGFGKTVGTVQIAELGTLETPILLTNTLSVGTVSEALVRYMLEQTPEIGVTTGTVNPVVCECNDGWLNDIRGLHVQAEHVEAALKRAGEAVEEGAVGAGTGMTCYGLKGGIGTSSRVVRIGEQSYTVGVLVLSNFGRLDDLQVAGQSVGPRIREQVANATRPESTTTTEQAAPAASTSTNSTDTCDFPPVPDRDQGSIIIVMATDLPLSDRQLQRVATRAGVGLVRTGSYIGHGSGDLVLAFSTATRFPHESPEPILMLPLLHDHFLDPAFRAAAECTEEAILNSLVAADPVTGRDGHHCESLRDYL
ncbi:P1 family peptidase [Tumebacillus permanentifrigoris]|uniref:D-aminopeptidase n=1 Tax=Tumebacillus permanentifrigoris TaxID=378543 RepID=A0A316DAT7_9BACL|nr:P1 family peptidase [Tumebacillus permanentifrigoris]PWK14922.1 D-aminopeptidase [Tumebacillus permanentifrigoris]